MAQWNINRVVGGLRLTYVNDVTGQVYECGETNNIDEIRDLLQREVWTGDRVFFEGKQYSFKPVIMAAA